MASPPRPRSADRRVTMTAVALVILGLATALVIRWGSTASPSSASDLGDPVLGDPDAPVELVEYSDFECPYCVRHATQVKPAIVEEYVDAGIVRYVWRDLPLQSQGSRLAAIAARAAQDQGRFWEYHDALFAQPGRLDRDRLREAAETVGLDLAAFEEDLDTEAHAAAVEAGREEADRLGFGGTPSFTVNGERILGAQPFEVFAEVIERAAEEAG